ncbi:hypothetical protein CQZ93_25110 [Ochrobactrum vermis]|nr:hypothetical protein CQZ93_25110 [Ochrobactrum vermis]
MAVADARLAYLVSKNGLFALLPLSPQHVEAMRRDHGIYMAGSGRINVAGLTEANVPQFVEALNAVLANTVSR